MQINSSYKISIIFILLNLFPAIVTGQGLIVQPGSDIEINKLKLDSIVTYQKSTIWGRSIRYNKAEFVYNEDGKMTDRKYYSWHKEEKKWMPEKECWHDNSQDDTIYDHSGKEEDLLTNYRECKYDSNGKIVFATDSCIDSSTGKLVLYKRDIYVYDTNERLVSQGFTSADVFNLPGDQYQTEKTFNQKGDMTSFTCMTCRVPSGECARNEKTVYKYDENRNMVQINEKSGKGIAICNVTIKIIYDNAVRLEDMILPPGCRDLIYGLFLNNIIPEENCNNRIAGFSRKISFLTRKYLEKGKLYYSSS